MRNVLFALGIVGIVGAWGSAQFALDDSGFDYFAADDGYTAISFVDGGFVLSFSDRAPSDSSLLIKDIDFLPLDKDDEDEFNATNMRRYLPVEVDHNQLRVVYNDARLEDVLGNYDEQLAGLGFSRELESDRANGAVVRYRHGDTVARVVFTRRGEDCSVTMRRL